MLVYENNNTKKAYFAYSVEKTLSAISNLLHERTLERLEKDFRCEVIDCYDNPEYLKEILEDLYGKSYKTIIKKITEVLGEFDSDKAIFRIIKELNA